MADPPEHNPVCKAFINPLSRSTNRVTHTAPRIQSIERPIASGVADQYKFVGVFSQTVCTCLVDVKGTLSETGAE